CNEKKFQAAEKSKVKALIFDRLLYRHWNAYKEGKRSHLFVVKVLDEFPSPGDLSGRNIIVIPHDLTPGDYDAPVFSLADRTTTPSRLTGRRFATPRITTRSKPRPPTTISGSSRSTGGRAGRPSLHRTSPPTIPPATRLRSIRPMASTSPTAPSSVRDTRATA